MHIQSRFSPDTTTGPFVENAAEPVVVWGPGTTFAQLDYALTQTARWLASPNSGSLAELNRFLAETMPKAPLAPQTPEKSPSAPETPKRKRASTTTVKLPKTKLKVKV